MLKRFFAFFLTVALILFVGEPIFAATSFSMIDEEKMCEAYIVFSERLDEKNVTASVCLEDFISGYTWDTDEVLEKYIDELVEKEVKKAEEHEDIVQLNLQLSKENQIKKVDNDEVLPRASIVKKWYDNIGTTSLKLSHTVSYSKYSLRSNVKKGDIVQETRGLVATITGHIAIVEGEFYDTSSKQFYIRTIEAGIDGVVRGVLDDTRVDERGTKIHYVPSATSLQITDAVNFCYNQLGKDYGIGTLFAPCDYANNNSDWYCTELVWAAYYNYGVNLNGGMLPINIFMPASLGNSYMLSRRSIS